MNVEHPEDFIMELLELINELRKVTDKINLNKSVVSLYTNNELSER